MGELINGRTAEEIKHVTEWACFSCGGLECDECEYRDACTIENRDRAVPDAYALIQHLEAERDAALAKVPKWISVKERLPVKQYRVIVRTGHNLVTTGWRSYHVDVKGGELWEVDEAHNYRNDVTHWMSLPNLPEEDM